MNNSVKYISIRLTIIILMVVGIGCIHQFTVYPTLLKEEGWLKEFAMRRTQNKADILYLSSSPNNASAPSDKDQSSISSMVESGLKNMRINAIDTGAIHAGIFLEILKRLPSERIPDKLIIHLNLRSFGPQWYHSDLENSLQRNLLYWNNYPGIINHLRAALKNYQFISNQERTSLIQYEEKFNHLPFGRSHQTIKKWCDSLWLESPNNMYAFQQIRHFGFQIKENNPTLQNYLEIVRWCIKNNKEVTLVLLPENVHAMNKNIDQDLFNLTITNSEFLVDQFQQQNCTVLNLCDDLTPSHFFEDFPTEHYDFEGRKHIAQQLITQLQHGN